MALPGCKLHKHLNILVQEKTASDLEAAEGQAGLHGRKCVHEVHELVSQLSTLITTEGNNILEQTCENQGPLATRSLITLLAS
jgi:hypothetical protein